MAVNDAAQNFRFAMTFLGFIGDRCGETRFQMRGDEREGEIGCGLNVDFCESALDLEAAAVQQEKIICVRTAACSTRRRGYSCPRR